MPMNLHTGISGWMSTGLDWHLWGQDMWMWHRREFPGLFLLDLPHLLRTSRDLPQANQYLRTRSHRREHLGKTLRNAQDRHLPSTSAIFLMRQTGVMP